MSFAGGGGKGRVRSDINITPLVDVVLVLLIIFMVMTPIMLKELDLQVPEKVEMETQLPQDDQVVLGIAADGTISLNREPLAREGLEDRIREVMSRRREKVMFFDVDDDAGYGDVVAVMDTCRGAGAKVLGIMTR
ncbi:MAG: biopolymer transporter ExbD [Deltaproteobacteria bacterium]|nr:biopolymer transporter ExbD [Deltaproteobacteria bacterium]